MSDSYIFNRRSKSKNLKMDELPYVSINVNMTMSEHKSECERELSVSPTESISMKMSEYEDECGYEFNCESERGYKCEYCRNLHALM